MKITDNEQLIIRKLEKFIYEESSNIDFLVQIIELVGAYLNLKTISDYAKENKLSYNGVKNNRFIKTLFNVKFVIDND